MGSERSEFGGRTPVALARFDREIPSSQWRAAKTTIRKWGNYPALRIPQAGAARVREREGDAVTLTVGAETLPVNPVARLLSLDDLQAEITPENLHPATDGGQDVGQEVVVP